MWATVKVCNSKMLLLRYDILLIFFSLSMKMRRFIPFGRDQLIFMLVSEWAILGFLYFTGNQ